LSKSQRFVVAFAGSAVAVEVESPRAAALVDFVVPIELCVGMQGDPAPHCTLRVSTLPGVDGEPPAYTIYRDDVVLYQTANEGDLAEYFQSQLCRQLATESRGGLLFHAAGMVTPDGCGVLIPGGIGAGKSTLTAWLLWRGLDYMTDELVYFPWGVDLLQPYTRPLHLKRPSTHVLRQMGIIDLDNLPAGVLSGTHSALAPASLIRQGNDPGPTSLRVALFPAYQPEAVPLFEPLSPAQTAQCLLQSLTNARNLPDHGFHEAVRLARGAAGYRLVYSHFS
jgi:hypothetical protein